MNFKKVSQLSALLSKSFAEEFLRLLVIYHDISASEAASRLDLHIKTAQDFLEELTALDIIERNEVYEKKRPYFRYVLKKKKLTIEVDFFDIYNPRGKRNKINLKIRERKNTGAIFSTSVSNDRISSVSFFTGEGRNRKTRKVNLTNRQGKFLYHLPFPSAHFTSIQEMLSKTDIEESSIPEILDIVETLERYNVIEIEN